MRVKKKKFETVEQYIFWCYANMAMSHVALKNNHINYETLDYMIRAKLYKGLCNKSMNIRTLFDDEKYKLSNHFCAYCGSIENLSLDHLIARKKGGIDTGDNLIYACKSCNSSKNKKDLLEWYTQKLSFPPIIVLRRYLKLAYKHFERENLLEQQYSVLLNSKFIFRLDLLPYDFPPPHELKL